MSHKQTWPWARIFLCRPYSSSFMIVLVLSKHYERVLNMNQRVLQLKEISCSVVWWYGTVLTVKFAAFWWYIISLKCILQRTRLKKENSVKVDYNIVHMLNLYMYKYSTNLYIFILMSKSTCHMCKRQLEPIQPISLCHFIQWFRWNWIIPDGDSVFPLMSSSCSAWTLCGLKVLKRQLDSASVETGHILPDRLQLVWLQGIQHQDGLLSLAAVWQLPLGRFIHAADVSGPISWLDPLPA